MRKVRVDAVGVLISRRSKKFGDLQYSDDEVGDVFFLERHGNRWANATRNYCVGEENINYKIISRIR